MSTIKERLEYLRSEIRAERISYGEIAELQNLAPHIEKGDVELLQWAGIPELSNSEKNTYNPSEPTNMLLESEMCAHIKTLIRNGATPEDIQGQVDEALQEVELEMFKDFHKQVYANTLKRI